MRLSPQGLQDLVEATGDFSFAYLKELWLSSMMRWIQSPRAGAMDLVAREQADNLRLQMRSAPPETSISAAEVDDDEEE